MSDEGSKRHSLLIVDDNAANLEVLSAVLRDDYHVRVATHGNRALHIALSHTPPDLILLDVVMPDMSGYDVCRRLKSEAATRHVPVIFVSGMGEVDDETAGLEAGGVDYVTKPISPPIVRARVRTHLRLYEQTRELSRMVCTLEQQARELENWNKLLEQRVAAQVDRVARLERLTRYFSPSVSELIVSGAAEDPLRHRRREIVVVFLDLRGFTAFAESADPEDVMRVIGEYHAAMGPLIVRHDGTLERFGGDSIMVFFNDPVPIPDPAWAAVRMALEMRERFAGLATGWRAQGYALEMGIGVAQGYATIGAIGFDERRDYGAIGPVTNLAARLCGDALGGQILITQRVLGNLRTRVEVQPLGERALKGFARPVPVFDVVRESASAEAA